jgi:glyoxylase-like metal-dependent hydrolase (beta-lactamase superfamily II)
VTGGNDPRLGTIHLVLLSHMHGDHVGDLKLKAPGEGTCANSARVPAPNSTTAEVVAAKNAVLVTTRAMAGFVHNKVDTIRGSGSKPMDFCPTLAVKRPDSCGVQLTNRPGRRFHRPGRRREARRGIHDRLFRARQRRSRPRCSRRPSRTC